MIVFPLVLFFILGYLFKVHFAYTENAGKILTRLIINITLPATILISTSNTKDIAHVLYIPLVAVVIQLLMFVIFYLLARKLKLAPETESVFVTIPLITNTLLFMAPFFYLAYGDQGLTRVVLYDIGNAFTIYFFAQAIFIFYGKGHFNLFSSIKPILASVPLWAFFLGLIISLLDLSIPEMFLKPLSILKEVNVFLPMFILGFYFQPTLKQIKLVLFSVTFRMLLGLAIGVVVSFLLTNSMDRITVIMAASAPIGLMSLIFSAEYEKDTQFASSIVSYSMILGLIMCTILDHIFRIIGWV